METVDTNRVVVEKPWYFPLRRLFALIKFGGDLEASLVEAASKGDTIYVGELIRAGADIRANKNRALRAAADNGHNNTVAYLLAHGADHRDLPEGSLPREEYHLS